MSIEQNPSEGESRLMQKHSAQFPSNAHSDKTVPKKDEARVQKVVVGKILENKPGFGRRLIQSFKGDDMGTVGNYVLFDVVIPAGKTLLLDVILQTAQRSMFGGTYAGRAITSAVQQGVTNYSRPGQGAMTAGRGQIVAGSRGLGGQLSPQARAQHDFTDILLESRGDAEAVLDGLIVTIQTYDVATVGDYLGLCGKTPEFVDARWGWDDLRSAKVIPTSNGYLVSLPQPKQIL